jgi:single-strand DNA-binding protein
MNSCILMAEIIKNPELRYTPDNQMAVADMFVQFAPPLGSRPEERNPTIEVVGWGNLATEIKENYKQGDLVTIEGRLEMNTIERDGFKEKRARLVASKIYHMMAIDAPAAPASSASSAPKTSTVAPSSPPPSSRTTTSAPRVEEPPALSSEDIDEIPF